MRRTAVIGAGGVRLAVREAGPADAPPVVLLHGWAQSSAVWAGVLASAGEPASAVSSAASAEGRASAVSSAASVGEHASVGLADRFRLVAADLRGHGESDAPAEGYADPAAWAGDVAALLAHAGRDAVLVGWSYGGLVIADYLRRHGTAGVAGLVLVGAITEIGRGRPGGRVGPAMRAALPAALDEDPTVAVPALLDLITAMDADALPGEVGQWMLGTALRVPPRVRAALFRRDVTSADVLAAVDVPALVLHGRRDAVVDPSAGEYAAATIPGAALRWFDDVGHLPFLERPAEFTAELAGFLERCQAARREVVR